MHPPKDKVCPFHRRSMAKVCPTCPLYVNVRGKHPQTGIDVDDWGCSFSWLPAIQIEAVKVFSEGTTGIQAATESLRNEVSRQHAALTTGSPRIAQIMPLRAEQPKLLGNGEPDLSA